MSEPYQLLVFLKDGLPPERVIAETDAILRNHGAKLDEDSMLYLEGTATEEPDPESVEDGDAALQELAKWPALGSISYGMPESMITVAFKSGGESSDVALVKIGILSGAFEAGGEPLKIRYQAIGKELFERFQAARAIMGWGLEASGLDWRGELDRLAQGSIEATYDLLDLRPPV